jgi:hypothetical protein
MRISFCRPSVRLHANRRFSDLVWRTISLTPACLRCRQTGAVESLFLCDVQFFVVHAEMEFPILLSDQNDGGWPGADLSITPRPFILWRVRLVTCRIIYGFWILTVITNKIFTINHNTQSHWNTLYTVLILHWSIPCIPTYALLAASLIHLLSSWLVLANLTVELHCLTVALNWSTTHSYWSFCY